ncbi:MAG: LpqB family beta-propeller domain-containing protein [Archangium sp.]|nr:LpqB family beta-propeller domain-containing protein [Archangium sp.]MDP3572459.1 LpqB family beta-propeller domain-containing protein [Archangium sp.]
MTPPRRNPNKRLQTLTLAVTVALAVALGGIMYLSLTSLPYLATSPTTDPSFGALNACLLSAVPERLGFAVSRDGASVAAWSPRQLVVCAGTPPVATVFPRRAITQATWDGEGGLWIASGGFDGGTSALLRLENGEFVERGAFAPAALVGTAKGVVGLEPSGQLIALSSAGEVSATRALPTSRNVHLQVSGDGALVALYGGGRFAVVDAVTLESTPAEAPCPVKNVWWRAGVPLLLVECIDLALEINALDSHSALAEPRRRIPATLVGAPGLYIQSCDVLPCTVEAPR